MANEKKNDEATIKKCEIKGYTEFGRSGIKFKWDSSLENLMECIKSRTDERSWIKALEILKIQGGEKILDFGAGRCWASYAFSKMGCNVVALDINVDDVVGLGAGKTIIKNTEATFYLAAGDCEYAPFKDNTFDIVFGFQVLHHAFDLNQMVTEASRIVKKNGIVIVVFEHKRGFFQSDRSFRQQHPATAFLVNEHAPTYYQYITAFKNAGLQNIDMFYHEGWEFLEDAIKQTDTIQTRFASKLLKIPLFKRIIMSKIVRKLALIFLPFPGVTIVGVK